MQPVFRAFSVIQIHLVNLRVAVKEGALMSLVVFKQTSFLGNSFPQYPKNKKNKRYRLCDVAQ